MEQGNFTGEDRAGLPCVIANGHNEIEGDVEDFADFFGRLLRNIDSGFGHDSNRPWVEPMGFDPRRIWIDVLGPQSSGKALRHLAATGVARAEKEDLAFPLHSVFWA